MSNVTWVSQLMISFDSNFIVEQNQHVNLRSKFNSLNSKFYFKGKKKKVNFGFLNFKPKNGS